MPAPLFSEVLVPPPLSAFFLSWGKEITLSPIPQLEGLLRLYSPVTKFSPICGEIFKEGQLCTYAHTRVEKVFKAANCLLGKHLENSWLSFSIVLILW